MNLTLDLEVKRPPVRYHGSKWLLAPWIIEQFPPHKVYVEPYGGGAGVLLRKPRSSIEIYNDIDSDVVNYFRVLRDPELAKRLVDLVYHTPFSREEFEAAYESSANDLESARRFVFRAYAGFGTHSHNANNSNGFRWMKDKPYAKEWANLPETLADATARFRGVTIENIDAKKLILRADSEETLFFLDPTYLPATRNSHGKGYRFEMSRSEHVLLADLLKRLKGKVVISGYPSDLYDRELFSDWRRLERVHYASGQNGRAKRVEVLWMNY